MLTGYEAQKRHDRIRQEITAAPGVIVKCSAFMLIAASLSMLRPPAVETYRADDEAVQRAQQTCGRDMRSHTMPEVPASAGPSYSQSSALAW
jgi:hypothetical protein